VKNRERIGRFRELKQLVFKNAKCTRVDKFLVTHIRSLAGAVKILQANNLHTTSNNSDDFDDNIVLNKCNVRSICITPNTTNNSDTSINNSTDDSRNFKITTNENDIKYVDVSTAPIDINPSSDSNIEDTSVNLSSTYLNKMENWKGKNNSPKKRGRYLTVCPDIENIYLKSKFTMSTLLLKW